MKINILNQLVYLLAISLIMAACGGSKTDQDPNKANTNSATNQTNNTGNANDENSPAPAPTPEAPKISDHLGYGNWYEGTVGEHKIWLYFAQNSVDYGFGAYGYESSKGKSIDLRGEAEDVQWRLTHTNYEKNTSEEFILKANHANNQWEGEWTGNDKKLAVKLNPKTTQPKSATGFLAAFADAQYPSLYDNSTNNEELLEKYYAEKKYGVTIDNIHDFVKEVSPFGGANGAEENAKIAADAKATLLFKTQLANGNYLVFFKTNLEGEFMLSYKTDAHFMGTAEEVVCAAILDKSGNVAYTRAIISNPEDPYFADINFKLTKADEYEVTITSYMRADRARVEEGKETLRFKVKENQIVDK